MREFCLPDDLSAGLLDWGDVDLPSGPCSARVQDEDISDEVHLRTVIF